MQPAPPPKTVRPPTIHAIDTSAIRHIIAVGSGKGGVGKSTVAVNLAAALVKAGHKVGLLDADIYGPSIPRMLGLSGRPVVNDNKKLVPLETHHLKVMSIGFITDSEAAVIWRGPMVQTAVVQMLRDVAWGALDYLIIDLPPGTGDVQLTLAQQIKLTGAIIVSTPQDIALIDARKAAAMFTRVNVPILGIVENMSMFCCPNCGHETPVFAQGGAKAEAEKLSVPLLAEIPLDMTIREHGDAGQPVVWSALENKPAAIYTQLAATISENQK